MSGTLRLTHLAFPCFDLDFHFLQWVTESSLHRADIIALWVSSVWVKATLE